MISVENPRNIMGFGINMKKIKILIVTVFLTAFGSVTYADVGDVYYCNIKQASKTTVEYSQPVSFNDNAFTFKRNKSSISFGSKGVLSNQEYPATDSINDNTELFLGGDKTTVKVVYKDGLFLFSTLSFIENSITSIVANCEVF